jgi:hypothetical protein
LGILKNAFAGICTDNRQQSRCYPSTLIMEHVRLSTQRFPLCAEQWPLSLPLMATTPMAREISLRMGICALLMTLLQDHSRTFTLLLSKEVAIEGYFIDPAFRDHHYPARRQADRKNASKAHQRLS